MTSAKPRVLFLCTHNAARSQMAEGITRHLGHGSIDVYSAGTEPSGVHPLAIQALKAMGIDITGQRSKHVDEFEGQRFDYVITLCDSAREACPVFPDAERIHWSFADPSAVPGSEAERRGAFKRTAQELNLRLRSFTLVVERGLKRSPA
jgi:arsenate reductase